jgi:putative endonuclease
VKDGVPTGLEKKLRARGFGRRGEWAALAMLLCKRYRVLARNYSSAGGEIDLVVMRGETIAFVEVKARPDVEIARTAISFEKRRRIVRATRAWIGQNKWSAGYNLRGDAVFISPRRWPEHLENAFELDLF